MSARIVVNLEPALASSAIDRGPDGGTWLSVWGDKEMVLVKLSGPSLRALWFALSKELGAERSHSSRRRERQRRLSREPAAERRTRIGRTCRDGARISVDRRSQAVMGELELVKTLSPLGVGGLLACVIFVFYRLDFLRERQNHVAEHERQARREERLLDVIERNAKASERLAVTIETLGKALERDGRHH